MTDDDRDAYALLVTRTVMQQLLELPVGRRQDVIMCMRTELTGAYGDQSSSVDAWHLPSDVKYWATLVTCGSLVTYQALDEDQRKAWAASRDRAVPTRGFMVMYLLVEVDPGGAL